MLLNKLQIKEIPNYEGIYEITSLGQVFRVNKNGKRQCKPFFRNNYLSVALSKNGKVKQFTIHRLLAICFIPNPENKPTVNHINGIKTDNNLKNLEWSTMSEQIKHAIEIGIFTPKEIKCVYDERLREKRRSARLGSKLTDETKNKIKQSSSIQIISSDGLVFNDISSAANYENMPKTTFHRKMKRGEEINGKTYNQNKA